MVWCGTDDGYIQLTTDDGKSWQNVTPPELTAWSRVTGIEGSHFDANVAYASVDRHQLQDFEPYLYRTRDAGKSWQKITKGLPAGVYVHVVKEDPQRRGLLFAGTERGAFVSLDDGDTKRSTLQLVRLVLDESGYTRMWQEDKTPEAPGRLENLKELVTALAEFENLQGFLEHISLVMDADQAIDEDKVNIMTLHSAKGLEFGTVFLPGWEEGLFPHQRSLDDKGRSGLEEERRLAYVGITRAKRRAVISFAQNRRVHNLWQSALPSRFIDELPQAHVEVAPMATTYGGHGLGGLLARRFNFSGAFAPCVIGSYGGGKMADPRIVEAARTLGAGNVRVLLEVVLPSEMPADQAAFEKINLLVYNSLGQVLHAEVNPEELTSGETLAKIQDEVPTSENVNGETKHPHRNRNGVDGAQDCSRYSKPMSPAVGAFRFLQGSNCDERSEWDRPESRDAENREGFST